MCTNLEEKSPPSPSSSNINFVKIESLVANHSKELEIVDKSVTNNSWINTQTSSLDEMLNVCVSIIDGDEFVFDGLIREIKTEKENSLTSQLHSNLHNHKRKIFVSNTHDGNLTYYCTKKKIRSDVPRQKPRSRHEVAVGVPKIFSDQLSKIKPCKKTSQKFVQMGICLSLPSTIDKCIECRIYQMRKNLTKCDYDNISCRFYAFRQLRFNKSGALTVAGYPDPYKNLNIIDMGMWLPGEHSSTPSKFNIQASIKILEDVGGQFCKFVQDENDALELNWFDDLKRRKILWKKCVNGVREMCDVCRTTIFNHHWSCRKCGFVVCVDCFRTKFKDTQTIQTQFNLLNENNNQKKWLPCSNQEEHQVDQLSITQILAGNALNFISKLMHKTCIMNNILIDCNCDQQIKTSEPHISINTDIFPRSAHESNISEVVESDSPTLKSIINSYEHKNQYFFCESGKNKPQHKDYLTSISHQSPMSDNVLQTKKIFAPKLTLTLEYKTNSPHMWLCEGRLLRLLNPKCNDNYEIFQVYKNIRLIFFFSQFISMILL